MDCDEATERRHLRTLLVDAMRDADGPAAMAIGFFVGVLVGAGLMGVALNWGAGVGEW